MEARKTKAAARLSSKEKEIIKGYERLYGAKLTEEELNEIIDRSFTNPAISRDTKEKAGRGLKEKKKGRIKGKIPKKTPKKG